MNQFYLVYVLLMISKETLTAEASTSLSCLCILFIHSPVTVPAEPSGFPRAACHWPSFFHWGWLRTSTRAFPRSARIGWYYSTDGKAGNDPRSVQLEARVSEQQPGGEDGSFPYRSNYWSRSYFDLGSPPICQAATTCWWHVIVKEEEEMIPLTWILWTILRIVEQGKIWGCCLHW